jgi:hypothetical protein
VPLNGLVPRSQTDSKPPSPPDGLRNRLLRLITAIYDAPTIPPEAPTTKGPPSPEGFGEFTPVVSGRRRWR